MSKEFVGVRIGVADLEVIDREARERKITRSEVIRFRIERGGKPEGFMTKGEKVLIAVICFQFVAMLAILVILKVIA
jgi:hypothetical protein